MKKKVLHNCPIIRGGGFQPICAMPKLGLFYEMMASSSHLILLSRPLTLKHMFTEANLYFISIYIIKLASQLSFQDHIVEVLSKWDNIDDEIWAKV